jgi:NTE family protein
MASACLPQMYPAVEIDGEAYWDGGFTGNPALYPLIDSAASPDIVVVQINPIRREEIPRTARDIINRVNEVSFNSSLIKELRAIRRLQQIIAEENLDLGPKSRVYMHLIHVAADAAKFSASSKLNAEWDYLELLFKRGRVWADEWLEANYDRIGVASTLDLDEMFGESVEAVDCMIAARHRDTAA